MTLSDFIYSTSLLACMLVSAGLIVAILYQVGEDVYWECIEKRAKEKSDCR